MAIPLLGPLLDLGGKLIDKLIPDPGAKAAAQLELLKLGQTGELAQLAAETQLALGQIEVNKIEAASESPFKSNWRPAVGWVCVLALASQYVIGPMFEWLSVPAFGERVVWPISNAMELMTLLGGILGLGALRTTEKVKGVA